jgi:hypothetical protein
MDEKQVENKKGDDILADAMSVGLPSGFAHDVLRERGHEGLREEIAKHLETRKSASPPDSASSAEKPFTVQTVNVSQTPEEAAASYTHKEP